VLDELRQEHDRRGEELRLHSALPTALAALSAVEQTALYDAYGVGERIEGVRRPLTEEGRRAVLRMAKRNLLHALRDAPDLADHPWLTIPRLNTSASTSPGPAQIARQLAQEPTNAPAIGAKSGGALNGFLGAPAQGSGHAETSASPTALVGADSAPAPAAPVLVAREGGAAQVAAPVEGGAGAVAGVAEAMSASRRALRQRWAICATGWLRARGGRSAGAGQ